MSAPPAPGAPVEAATDVVVVAEEEKHDDDARSTAGSEKSTGSTRSAIPKFYGLKRPESKPESRPESRIESRIGRLCSGQAKPALPPPTPTKKTLRLYPIAAMLTRQCMETYKVPDSDLTLEKGTMVGISVFGIQRDEEYYPNPEKFDPDRFSEENKALRNPYTFLAFGEGPKMCIGTRFGMMQVKIALITLLRDFKFTLNKKTLDPMEFDNNIFLTAKGGIWLDVFEIKH